MKVSLWHVGVILLALIIIGAGYEWWGWKTALLIGVIIAGIITLLFFRLAWGLIALAFVIGAGLGAYIVMHNACSEGNAAVSVPAPLHIAAPPKPVVAVPVPVKSCPSSDEALLSETRDVRLGATYAKIAALQKAHKFSAAAADALVRYVRAHPDGDVPYVVTRSADTLDLVVTWKNATLGDGDPLGFPIDDKRHCVCRDTVTFYFPPPKPTVVVIPPPAGDGCNEIDFDADDVSRVQWGVVGKGADGAPVSSGCIGQRQGVGRFRVYGECHCYEDLRVIEEIMHTALVRWFGFDYEVKDHRQTVRVSRAIATTQGVYICLIYPDGRTRATLIRPEDWKGRHRIVLTDGDFGN